MRAQRALAVAALAAAVLSATTAATTTTTTTAASTGSATGLGHPRDTASPTPAGSAVTRTDAGLVRGVRTAAHRTFRGIPYAAAPTGDLRWAAPRPVPPWPGVRDATAPGPLCAQVPAAHAQLAAVEEDCLVVNVTAPARTRAPGRTAPVLVWIHGDGTVGAGEFFDGRRLADRGVVVVTVNYRLGVFGGFAHPGLPGSGTFALQDQQAALRWVRRNATAFGGDPDRVTVAGSSFGATAITAHLTSPSARGLFQRAALSSGEGMMDMPAGAMGAGVPAYPWYGWRTTREMQDTGTETASSLGCSAPDPEAALRCLRALPVERLLRVPYIMNAFQAFAFGNEVLPELPEQALREGRFHRVPVLSGATRDEHRLFVGAAHDAVQRPFTDEQFGRAVETAFPGMRECVLAEYPVRDHSSPALAWSAVVTDRMWARGTYAQHIALSRFVPTYAYEFADRDAPMYLPFPASFDFGAYHASDTPYLFEDPQAQPRFTPAQVRLSNTMSDYWAAFATGGSPNGPGLPYWPRFDDAHHPSTPPRTQSLAPDRIAPVDYASIHNLDFWNANGTGCAGQPSPR
ncbi:carboxylesterase/lipase family protein [Embleya sp. NPDC050154]|uniref:carboxylesterase/lipase family protein n=1 Tax=Embleya sp. NPDC050154 TaxID=3363988 RepID=UPI0037B5E12B